MDNIYITGDRELWGVAIENLLDNQLRYAVNRIVLSLAHQNVRELAVLRVWNDGPPSNPGSWRLFEQYHTGKTANLVWASLSSNISQMFIRQKYGQTMKPTA